MNKERKLRKVLEQWLPHTYHEPEIEDCIKEILEAVSDKEEEDIIAKLEQCRNYYGDKYQKKTCLWGVIILKN